MKLAILIICMMGLTCLAWLFTSFWSKETTAHRFVRSWSVLVAGGMNASRAAAEVVSRIRPQINDPKTKRIQRLLTDISLSTPGYNQAIFVFLDGSAVLADCASDGSDYDLGVVDPDEVWMARKALASYLNINSNT